MNQRRIVVWSVIVALAGFLFGFDTVVISGADLALQELWPRGAFFHGFVVMASALWGTVAGAIFGGIPTDTLGRKRTLFWIGALYFISAVGSALANDPWMFAVFRFVGGLAIGSSTVAAPAYISEIAPPDKRGRLVAVYQFKTIFQDKYRFPLQLAFLVAFFNQFSGINAFLYYAPRIFAIAGLEQSSALLSSIGIGLTNLVFTLAGLALIDRFGRRQLMYIGSVGYIVSLSLVALAFVLGWKGLAVPVFLFLFIASHAIGQGTVIWVFISEIFPNHLRASGQAFGSSVHWVLAAIIPALVPVLFTYIGAAPVFAFFAFMMVLQLACAVGALVATKKGGTPGVSAAEIAGILPANNG